VKCSGTDITVGKHSGGSACLLGRASAPGKAGRSRIDQSVCMMESRDAIYQQQLQLQLVAQGQLLFP